MCDVFVPSKVPLSDRWFARVPPERRYGPAEALAAARVTAGGRPVELVVDLTNSSRYYDPRAFESAGRLAKVACVGKDEPDPVAVTQFVYVVGKFLAERAQRGSNGVILVHCTHGYNRTGAMLVHYMQRTRSWPKLNEHVAEFARARPPCGIYKPEYIRELFDEYLERRFRTTIDPPLPDFKRGEAKTDAPPLDDANVPADDLFGSLNPDYVATRAASRAPRPGAREVSPGSATGRTRARRPREGTRTVRPCTTTTCWERRFSRAKRERFVPSCCGCAARRGTGSGLAARQSGAR